MKTFLGLAIFITLVGTGFALRCYVCNSHHDKDCKDLSSTRAQGYLKECGNEPDGEKFTLCRKIDMHMDMDYGKFHDAENRVHRACGWEEDAEAEDGDCYYKSGYNTRSWVCACKKDDCNGASLPSVGFAVLLPVIVTAVLRMGGHY